MKNVLKILSMARAAGKPVDHIKIEILAGYPW
jgi:hypothetical protein